MSEKTVSTHHMDQTFWVGSVCTRCSRFEDEDVPDNTNCHHHYHQFYWVNKQRTEMRPVYCLTCSLQALAVDERTLDKKK
jgi:hypothetical protein